MSGSSGTSSSAPVSGRAPATSDIRPRDHFIAGAEHDRLGKTFRIHPIQCWCPQIDREEIRPTACRDPTGVEAQRLGSAPARGIQQDRCNLAILIGQAAPDFLAKPLAVFHPADLLDQVETIVAIGTDGEPTTCSVGLGQTRTAVAQVAFGKRAETYRSARAQEAL